MCALVFFVCLYVCLCDHVCVCVIMFVCGCVCVFVCVHVLGRFVCEMFWEHGRVRGLKGMCEVCICVREEREGMLVGNRRGCGEE